MGGILLGIDPHAILYIGLPNVAVRPLMINTNTTKEV
jgi:hypothetical protein